MLEVWDCLLSFLTTEGTRVSCPRLKGTRTRLRPVGANGGNTYPPSWFQYSFKESTFSDLLLDLVPNSRILATALSVCLQNDLLRRGPFVVDTLKNRFIQLPVS